MKASPTHASASRATILWIGTTLLMAILPPGFARPGLQAQDLSPLESEYASAIKVFGEEALIDLDDGQLTLRMPTRERAMEMGRMVNRTVGASSYSGGGSWGYFYQSPQMRLTFEEQVARPFSKSRDLTTIQADVNSPKLWLLEFSQSPDQFMAWSFNPISKQFVLAADNGNKTQLIQIGGGKIRRFEDSHFDRLSTQNDLTELLAPFQEGGIRLNLGLPWDDVSRVLQSALAVSPDDWIIFEQEFADLETPKFAERKAAETRLSQAVSRWVGEIVYGLVQDDTPSELKSRLRTAVRSNLQDPTHAAVDHVVEKNLLSSPLVLTRLLTELNRSPDSTQLARSISERLHSLTDQEFGLDDQAWSQWLKQQEQKAQRDQKAQQEQENNQEAKAPEDDSAVETPPPLWEAARDSLTRLLPMRLSTNGQLKIHRESWRAFFGGHSMQDIVARMQAQYNESRLPANWLNLGGDFDLSTVDYPQALFEQLRVDLEPIAKAAEAPRVSRPNQNVPFDRNRQVENSLFSAQLFLHSPLDKRTEAPADPEFFSFVLREKFGPRRVLWMYEEPDGALQLFLIGAQQQEILWLIQEGAGGCELYWSSSSAGNQTLQGESFQSLFSDHDSLFREHLLPFLAEMGVPIELQSD